MLGSLGYHSCVRHTFLAPVAVLALFAASLFLAPRAQAQINGAPSSVTSPGFGGRAINGAPPSVTSLGPRGYSSDSRLRFSTTAPNLRRNGDGHPRRHRNSDYFPYYYAVPVPYALDNSAAPNEGADYDDADYQGGPTIFDRRGQGERSYIPPVKDVPTPHAGQPADASLSDPAPAQDPTVLVFKDGHKTELGNYAIVGTTLYDLTPGHPRKVLLADLDLVATQKVNEDRGVIFQLPPALQAN